MTCRSLFMIFCGALLIGCHPGALAIKKVCVRVNRAPSIRPDFFGTVLPSNIAPLNFMVVEPGVRYIALISPEVGKPIEIAGDNGTMRIPAGPWKRMLTENRGKCMVVNIYVCDTAGRWQTFDLLTDTIAQSPIDPFVTYRALTFQYNYSTDLRLFERDVGSFKETELVNTNDFAWGCCNCHIPFDNDPRTFTMQIRTSRFGSGMLVARDGKIAKIGARLGYPAWHPGGRMIAFSRYKVEQVFHAVGGNFIDVYDRNSDLVLYDAARETVIAVPRLSQKQTLETWPAWSPDGRYLYYCSSPVAWADSTQDPPEHFDKLRYSLLRIPFCEADTAWGDVDTVLSAGQTGLSISQPRISPDGRFLLFCMHAHGAYPHTQKTSDLYMMDLDTKRFAKLAVNSDDQEMWHCWSNNSRWILFSSKRGGGIFTRVYFSYIDTLGIAHKPFIMPQKNPAFYDSFIKSYNVPQFATGPVPFSERKLLRLIRSKAKTDLVMPAASDLSTAPEMAPRH